VIVDLVIRNARLFDRPSDGPLDIGVERGRVVANECLQVPDWPGVWALGDCALVPDPFNPGKFYPPTAQHATRQAVVLDEDPARSHGEVPDAHLGTYRLIRWYPRDPVCTV
jgi:NADPH-dependent 2,4-dienoyl-CoA reductase/sulfur reductase-like enzyme